MDRSQPIGLKNTAIERILVVCDQAAGDNIRKTLLMQAAPPGIKVHVLTVSKMLRLCRDERFEHYKVLVLVENSSRCDAFDRWWVEYNKRQSRIT